MDGSKLRMLWLPKPLLAACVLALGAWCLSRAADSPQVKLEQGCGRLCQARNLILNAKKALDNKAEAEIQLLKGDNLAHSSVKNAARAQESGRAARKIVKNLQRAGDSTHPITQQDLAKFVHDTIAEEKRIVRRSKKVTNPRQTARARQVSTPPQSSASTNPKLWYYCQDNPNWRGPFGDPCVSYAVGGDRQFWCDWDGAGDINACPVACGTCDPHYYYHETHDEGGEKHLLHEHFDPQVAPASREVKINITVNQGPQIPRDVARRRAMQEKVFQDIEAMKGDLMKVVQMTEKAALDRKKKEKDAIQPSFISSEQANRDMARFFSQESAKKDRTASMKNASWALTDLMSWFNDQEKQIHEKELREQERHHSHGTHEPSTKEGDYNFLKFPRVKVDKTIKMRRLSDQAADNDIQHYWKVAMSNASKSSMTSFSSARARRELESYLERKLQRAEQLHEEARDSARRRRKANGLGWEAVKSNSKMSTAQSQADIEKFWNSMPTEAVRIHPTGKRGRDAAGKQTTRVQQGRGQIVHHGSTSPDVSRLSVSQRRSADLSRAGRMMNDEESKSDMQSYWNSLVSSSSSHMHEGGRPPLRAKEQSVEEEVNSLGLPTGGAEAVALPHQPLTAEAAHASLEDYFSKMVNRARQLDGYDRKTREKLIAEAKLRAKKRAMLAAAKRSSELAALARRQQLYQAPAASPLAPPANRWSPVAVRKVLFAIEHSDRRTGVETSGDDVRSSSAMEVSRMTLILQLNKHDSQAQEKRLEYQQAYSSFLNQVNAQVHV